MKTSDFDYNLPEELIAHEPAKQRDHSRLMVLEREHQTIEHKHFYDLIDYLKPGDVLVLNDTKVIPARLFGIKEEGGAKIEILLVNRLPSDTTSQIWKCLVKPGKRLKVGSKVSFAEGELLGNVVEKLETGEQIIEFTGDFFDVIYRYGETPLPPYIKSENRNPKSELIRKYQTVYAEKDGASAAPTAGLHFTPKLLKDIEKKGVEIKYLTLHTGLGTFLPVRTDDIKEHKMHEEYFEIPKETAEAVKQAKRVVAVGTTVVRALESGGVDGSTDLFIYPGYKFKVVDALITNFHWPKSTLIMLVAAFAGKDFVMKAYQEAIKEKYRFYSFGDVMLIT